MKKGALPIYRLLLRMWVFLEVMSTLEGLNLVAAVKLCVMFTETYPTAKFQF